VLVGLAGSGCDRRRRRTLGRLGRVLVRERDLELEEATLPERVVLAGDTAVPPLEVHHAVCAAHGLGEEAKGMVQAPLFPGAVSTGGHDRHGGARTAPRRGGSCRETLLRAPSGRWAERRVLLVVNEALGCAGVQKRGFVVVGVYCGGGGGDGGVVKELRRGRSESRGGSSQQRRPAAQSEVASPCRARAHEHHLQPTRLECPSCRAPR
jgi:hypothetical protein